MQNSNIEKEKILKRIEKEKKMKKIEQEAIIEKSKLIENYSEVILKKLFDSKNNNTDIIFLNLFVLFLIDNNTEFSLLELKAEDKNIPDYNLSMSVIFKVCYNLPLLGFDVTTNKRFRDKIRLYTKNFIEDSKSSVKNNEFIRMNEEQLEKAKKYVKTK